MTTVGPTPRTGRSRPIRRAGGSPPKPARRAPARGWTDGDGYRLRFKRGDARLPAGLRFTYDVLFSLLEPDLALKTVRLRLFGLPIAAMTAFHRRV